jgi:hypothetical protein
MPFGIDVGHLYGMGLDVVESDASREILTQDGSCNACLAQGFVIAGKSGVLCRSRQAPQ